MSLELAKYMAQKWMEAELELLGYTNLLSQDDTDRFNDWFSKEHVKYKRMREEIRERAEWLDNQVMSCTRLF